MSQNEGCYLYKQVGTGYQLSLGESECVQGGICVLQSQKPLGFPNQVLGRAEAEPVLEPWPSWGQKTGQNERTRHSKAAAAHGPRAFCFVTVPPNQSR